MIVSIPGVCDLIMVDEKNVGGDRFLGNDHVYIIKTEKDYDNLMKHDTDT